MLQAGNVEKSNYCTGNTSRQVLLIIFRWHMEYEYAEEFPVTNGYKIFYCLLAFTWLGMGIFFWNYGDHSRLTMPQRLVICSGMFLLAVPTLANLRRKVVVTKRRVRYTGLFTTRELPLAAIKGWRQLNNSLVLEPVNAAYRRIIIGNYLDLVNGDVLLQWAARYFENLDTADLDTSSRQLLQDKTTGDIPEGRLRLLEQAKTLVPVYNTAASLAAFFSIIITGWFSSILLLLLPLVGVFLLFTHRGLIKFFYAPRRSIYPAVLYGILFSSLCLLIHAVFQYNVPGWPQLLLPSFIVAVVMALAIYKKGFHPAAGGPWGQTALIIFVCLVYGFGSTRLLNCNFDRGKPTSYTAIVEERFNSSTQTRGNYYLKLKPWGPQQLHEQVEVSRLVYRETAVGGAVTVQLKPGLLSAVWYWVEKKEDYLIQGKPRQ